MGKIQHHTALWFQYSLLGEEYKTTQIGINKFCTQIDFAQQTKMAMMHTIALMLNIFFTGLAPLQQSG